MMSCYVTRLVLIGCLVLLPASGWAQGHMTPGAGPINTAMGGAGVALPIESLGALTFNPALLAGAEGNQLSFATEFSKERALIDTTIGTRTGRATPTSQIGVLPTFGWMLRDPKGKLALGFGLVGISSMGTDFPADSASVLFAPAPNGLGRAYMDYREIKIPVAFAYQVTSKLAIGASVNVYLGSFGATPLPVEDADKYAHGLAYYPEAGRLTDSWALGGQVGFYYQASPMVSVGGSITTPQNFAPFKWNSTNPDPTSWHFGQPQTIQFDIDGPLIASVGVGLKPSARTRIALDAMFTKYEGVHGLGGQGGVVNGIVEPFGWRSIWTVKAGIEHLVTDKLTVRAGYNYSQAPVRSEVVVSSTGAPNTFQQYICGGFGMRMFPFLEMVASLYVAPRAHAIGSFSGVPGLGQGTLDVSNTRTSGLIGMNFRF